MILRAAILCLLLGSACGKPAPLAPPPSVPKAPVDGERAAWTERVRAIRPSWGRKELEEFLGPTSSLLHGGAFNAGPVGTIWFSLYALDGAWNLYVDWNGEDASQGIRSTDVVGFSDLRSRIDPGLFEAVAAIHRSPSAQDGLRFNSLSLIRAVNVLQPLGKERSLQALEAYLRLRRELNREELMKYYVDEYRILPIVAILFEHPGGMRPFRLGDPDISSPGLPHWPLFPLALVDDVPFMVVTGYSLRGRAQDPADNLRNLGPLRADPLLPRRTALEASDQLTQSEAWRALMKLQSGMEGRKRWLVRGQALGAMSKVFELLPEEKANDCCVDPSETQWRTAVDRAKAAGIVWSPEVQDFILGR